MRDEDASALESSENENGCFIAPKTDDVRLFAHKNRERTLFIFPPIETDDFVFLDHENMSFGHNRRVYSLISWSLPQGVSFGLCRLGLFSTLRHLL